MTGLENFLRDHQISKTKNNLVWGGFGMRCSESWIGLTIYSLFRVNVLFVIKEGPRQIAVLEGLWAKAQSGRLIVSLGFSVQAEPAHQNQWKLP